MKANSTSDANLKPKAVPKSFLRKHSLGLGALAVVITLIVAYIRSDPATHLGSFFGNAIADWTGVLVTVLMTKHLYEKGSAESKNPKGKWNSPTLEFLREHSLSVFLVITWAMWAFVFQPHGHEQPLGTGRRQHRVGVDADSRAGVDDEDPDGGRVEGELALTRAPHPRTLQGSGERRPIRTGPLERRCGHCL